jgi:hypothetical protein
MTATRPARYTFRELAHADALLENLSCIPNSPYAEFVYERRSQAATWRDAEVSKLKGLICWKCQGTGQTQWRHRSGGICFVCKGDGWTARGRKRECK